MPDPIHVVKEAALTDLTFRKQLIENPEAALKSKNITPTPELLAAINQAKEHLSALGDIFGVIEIEAFT